jgi:sugar lactone lactonase YvrE
MNYEVISSSRATLGEGISIRPNRSEVSWVDIEGNKVFWKNLESNDEGMLSDFELPSCTFSDGDSGTFISHLGGIDWVDKKYRNRQYCTTWFPRDSGLRCNDGKMDRKGNIWISTMSISHFENQGSIWFWDRKSKPILVLDNLSIPNSIAIDEARNKIYFADSAHQIIYHGNLNSDQNGIDSIKTFYSSKSGTPDGSTLDKQGNLWNTRWDGSTVVKISPNGEKLGELITPFLRPTSCVFLHDNVNLLVTSAISHNDVHSGHTVKIAISHSMNSILG